MLIVKHKGTEFHRVDDVAHEGTVIDRSEAEEIVDEYTSLKDDGTWEAIHDQESNSPFAIAYVDQFVTEANLGIWYDAAEGEDEYDLSAFPFADLTVEVS